MNKIIAHKNIFWSVLGVWIIFFLISVLGIIANDTASGGELATYIIFTILGFFALKKLRIFYKTKFESKAIFFTKAGYLVLGLGLGMVGISTIFNIFYEGDWFDFTDFGFYLASLPLSSVLSFQPDSDILSKRLILYLIVVLNIIIVSYLLDIISYLIYKVVIFLRQLVSKKSV